MVFITGFVPLSSSKSSDVAEKMEAGERWGSQEYKPKADLLKVHKASGLQTPEYRTGR